MSWRIACNSTLGLQLAGVLVTSALLPATLRTSASPTCSVSTMPPVIVTHGAKDTTTDVSFEDESVSWLAVAAKCSISTSVALMPEAGHHIAGQVSERDSVYRSGVP